MTTDGSVQKRKKNKKARRVVLLILLLLFLIILLFTLLTIFLKHYKKFNIVLDDGINKNNLLVSYNTKIRDLEEAKRLGLNFVCWSKDGIKCAKDSDKLNYDDLLYALYEKNDVLVTKEVKNIKITIKDTDGSILKELTLKEGESLGSLFVPSKEGFEFSGWLQNGSVFDTNAPIGDNIEIVPVWKEVQSVAPKIEQKTSPVNTTSKKNNTTSNTSSNTSRNTGSKENNSGNTQNNNNTSNPGNIIPDSTVNIKDVTITFDTNGGNNISSLTIKSGERVVKPDNPIKSKYIFKEWQLNGNTFDFSTPITGNITLKAVYKKFIVKLQIIDEYSPERKISLVDETGKNITFKSINYTDGTLLCTNTNTNVNKNDIEGETSFLATLSDNTQVITSIN